MSEENRKTEEKNLISEKDLITDEIMEKAAGGDGDMPPLPPINNGPLVCHRCGARFSRLEDFSRHIRNCT